MKINLVFAAAAVVAALPAATFKAAAAPPVVLISKLVDPTGTPALNASAVLDIVNTSTQAVTRLTYKPDQTGVVTMTIDPAVFASGQPAFYVISPTGFGLWDLANATTPGATSTSILEPFTSVEIHLTGIDGKPITNVKICPLALNNQNLYGLSTDPNLSQWIQTTDNNGYATLTRLPQGFRLRLTILDNRFAAPPSKYFIQLGSSATATTAGLELTTATVPTPKH